MRIAKGSYVKFLSSWNYPTGVISLLFHDSRTAKEKQAEERAMGHLWLGHHRPYAKQLKGVDPGRGLALSESQCSKMRNTSSVGARVNGEGMEVGTYRCYFWWVRLAVGADQRAGE